ncbi:hypothetical protein H0H93_004988 [Arthromyces matolae]|nr:hypothetical protein H0H93_004988 [Arthromyces matolae]
MRSHVFGQPAKKEYNYENVKVTNSAWDTNIISASGKYISVNWNSSGGGAFAILPLPSPFYTVPGFTHKLPDSLPLARSHTAAVLDTDWSPHNDSVVASGAEDGKVLIWKVEESAFEGWGQENWVPQDFDPVARIDASPRKIGQVLFHPTATNVLASASGEHTVKLWDLANTEDARSVLVGHGDAIQSLAFNPTGTLLATTCRDRKLRLFDPRTGGEPVRVVDGHGGIKGSRVTWMGDLDKIATTGFSKMSDRQVAVWETGGLGNVKTITLDQSSGVVMPFWSDNNILFLAGKGDGNVRYYEYESDNLYPLMEHKSSEPQRGMCFLPRRSLNVGECEIARAYKVQGASIEPIAFIVPRKPLRTGTFFLREELRDFEAQYLEGRGVPGAGGSKVANLFDNSKAVLNQAITFLDKYISSDDQLTKPSEFIPGSTIGKHLRHALDHFDVLMKSVSSSGSPPYRLSYDQKERDTSIESNLSAAKSAISTCIKLLNEHASSTQLDTPIILEAVTPAQVELKTTFGRELWSASMHCVHHWAMIRMIAGEHHIRLDVDKDFGYAPSTLVRYQSKI